MVVAGVDADVGAVGCSAFALRWLPLTHAMKSEGHVPVVLNPAQTLRFGWKQGWPPLPGPQMFSEHPSATVVVVKVVVVLVCVVPVAVVVVVVVLMVVVVFVTVVVVDDKVVVLLNSSNPSVGHAPLSDSSFSMHTPVAMFRHGPDDPNAQSEEVSHLPSIVVVVVAVVAPSAELPPSVGSVPLTHPTKSVPHVSCSGALTL